MDEPCDICGDIGVMDAIFTCSKCRTHREHIYCMLKYPKDAPDTWLCEPCKPSKETISPKPAVKEHLPKATMSNSKCVERRVGFIKEKKVEKGKVRFMSFNEAIMLTSGAKKIPYPPKSNLFSIPGASKTVESLPRRTSSKAKAISLDSSSYKLKENSSFRHGSLQIKSRVQPQVPPKSEQKGKTDDLVPIKEPTVKKQLMGSVNPAEESGTTKGNAQKPTNISSTSFSMRSPNIGIPGKKDGLASIEESTHKKQPMGPVKPAEESGTTKGNVEKAISTASSSFSARCPSIDNAGKRDVLAPIKEPTPKKQLMGLVSPAEENGTNKGNVEKATNIASSSFPMRCSAGILEAEKARVVNSLPKVQKLFPSHPAQNASWKGSFKFLDRIKDGEVKNGFQAHTPFRVRRKVYEFSKRMPEILQFEMHSRSSFWKHIFKDDIPNRDDIALYFFSSDGDGHVNYVFLLEYIETNDLLMRSYMDGVELLILTSKHLHMDSQRWREKHFLWGVFRHVKESKAMAKEHEKLPLLACPSHCSYSEENEEEADMDIDMIGGKDLGRVDVAIPRESSIRGCGTSRKERETTILSHGSDPANPFFSRKSDIPIKKRLIEVMKEVCDDFPSGFEGTCTVNFRDRLCGGKVREEKECRSMERVLEASRAGGSQAQKHVENS